MSTVGECKAVAETQRDLEVFYRKLCDAVIEHGREMSTLVRFEGDIGDLLQDLRTRERHSGYIAASHEPGGDAHEYAVHLAQKRFLTEGVSS